MFGGSVFAKGQSSAEGSWRGQKIVRLEGKNRIQETKVNQTEQD